MGSSYLYELRSDGRIVSTGHLQSERELRPGDRVIVAGTIATVREVVYGLDESEPRLILQA